MRGSVEDYSFEETAEDLELEVHDVERVYGALVDDVIDLATSFALSSDADFAATHLIEGMTAMPNTGGISSIALGPLQRSGSPGGRP